MHTTRSRILLPLLAVACLLIGCAPHAQQVRAAQDSFSEGAKLDLARKYNLGESSGSSDPFLDSQRYYALALGSANEALRSGSATLKSDDLYGTAMTIKALSLWRLGNSKESKEVAEQVVAVSSRNSGGTKIWPRDLGICKTIPVLVETDILASRALALEDPSINQNLHQTLNTFYTDCDQTLAKLNAVSSDSVLTNHPFQLYLAESWCELAVVMRAAGVHATHLPSDQRQDFYKQYNIFKDSALINLKNVAKSHQLGTEIEKLAGKLHTRYLNRLQPLP